MKKKTITLVTIDTINPDLVRRAIELTAAAIPYDTKVLTFSDKPIISGETRVPILPITSLDDYSELCLKGLWPFIDTEHFVIVQYDGFATNAQLWTDEFLTVDYIGAIWPWQSTNRIGNGGFSLRSRKLITALRDPKIRLYPEIKPSGSNEDDVICKIDRDYLEKKYSIRYANERLASQFSFEFGIPHKTFGMHGVWNVPSYCSKEDAALFLFNSPARNWNLERIKLATKNCMDAGYYDLGNEMGKYIEKVRPDIMQNLFQ